MSDLDEVKRRLSRFADEVAGSSPLYAHLAGQAATDDEVAALLAAAPFEEAHPTLLLAVAHRLIQADPIHPLSRYYPTLGGSDGADAETWPMFRAFLLERADKARALIESRRVQTNDVQRAAPLYPAVTMAAKQAGTAIALLEVGCSAGLLLGLDRFGYRYQCDGGEQFIAGPAKTPVGLHCAVVNGPGARFAKPAKKLVVGARAGLDAVPIDADDEDELAWLEACVWADHPERARLLRTAAGAQRRNPPEMIRGDAVDDLATAASTLPAELPLVVLTSHTLPYLDDTRRREFVAALAELSRARPTWWISEEPYETGLNQLVPGRDELSYERTGQGVLGFTRWVDGRPDAKVLAQTDVQGTRMTWLAR